MKLRNKIFVGFALLLVISIALTFPGATAEKPSSNVVKPTTLRVSDIVKGEGAITDDSGNLFTGHYQLRLFETKSENSDHQYIVKNGQFIIKGEDIRLSFAVDPNTWVFTENETGYTATGDVTDERGTTFNVELDAQMVHEFNDGCIYTASGSLSDGITTYNLQDSSVMRENTPH